ncbi:unnamed protein product [Oppiella nova]|uniref:Uncharacterized protein n=1 Tax=Oppiella nova TaxID=334625 RepID=A0A7R9QG67_9ACAR|nr:unnamed protein product [Oppiella nova]CAG2165267.1 unnamed protein product [Oppiella nova]
MTGVRHPIEWLGQSLALIWCVSPVFGYYCDHNFCQISSQYCCGDNLCCDYVNQTVFNSIVVVISIIIISSILWALFRLFLYNKTFVVIKTFGQKLTAKSNTRPIGQTWFEDPESSLLSDHLDVSHG